jgi:molybdopterin molybdotransferase
MPSYDDARLLILDRVAPVGSERLPLLAAAGRVAAEDVISPRAMPPFDNSAMDGFAIRVADCTHGHFLRISGYLPAGVDDGGTLQPGTAIPIMTGAPLPSGCDAIVPFENAEERDGAARPLGAVSLGQHIRRAGEDVRAGDIVIPAGTQLRPAEICAAAAIGFDHVTVYRKPRVAILSTGDELVDVGQPLTPGKIVNSNSVALAAAVLEAGAEPVLLGIAADTAASHREKIEQGLTADVLITSAGVSTGDRDLVRSVLAHIGVEEIFHRVDVKPGGPTAFAVKNGRPIFCLPGNPVAALLMFESFVRPALLKMLGNQRVVRRTVSAVLQDGARKSPNKTKLQRVRVIEDQGHLVACSAGDQNTGMLGTLVRAHGFAVLDAVRTFYAPGEEVEVQLLSNCLEMTSATSLSVPLDLTLTSVNGG